MVAAGAAAGAGGGAGEDAAAGEAVAVVVVATNSRLSKEVRNDTRRRRLSGQGRYIQYKC